MWARNVVDVLRQLVNPDMKLDEFESNYRDQLDTILNRLQSVALLNQRIEAEAAEIASSMQQLTEVVERFLSESRSDMGSSER